MHVILFLNHACNLACTYCYNGKKFDRALSLEHIEKGIDLAFESGDVRISFFGGEPLLEVNRIKHAVTYAREKEKSLNKKMLRFSMTVNGTLLDDEMLKYFRDENFFVAVSLDGAKKENDRYRQYPTGAGTYDHIARGLTLVKKHYGKMATSSTVDPGNVRWLADSFAHVIDLGVQRFSFNFNYDARWDDESLSIYKAQMDKVTGHFVDAYRQGNSVDYATFTSKINGHLNGQLKSKCLFGEGEVTVAPSGRLYPCERLVGEDASDELCIGHIDSGIDLEKVLAFKRARLHRDTDCENCQVESRCIHFCGCVNWATTGTIGNVSGLLCEVEQTAIRCADEAAAILFREKNPAFLKRFYKI